MLWLYEPSAQVYLEASSQIPLVADPTAQANFWSKIVPTLPKTLTYPGLVSVGDWKNFVPYDQGWIVHPPAGRGIGDQVIVPALTKPSALPQLVAAWEKSVQGA